MDNEELIGEAWGMTSTGGSHTGNNCSKNSSESCLENHEGWRGEWRLDSLSLDDNLFSTDVSDTERRRTGNLVRRSGGSAHWIV